MVGHRLHTICTVPGLLLHQQCMLVVCYKYLVTSAAARARPSSLQAMITRAPLATIASAVACPTPAVPPVMMQTCSTQDACQPTSQLDKADMP